VKDRVDVELTRIEREYEVRVLLAVESGSRAWGFASPDSDYDVRFVYVHPREWYVSIFEQRDVIEEMRPGDLDISGWDLRKTLRLFSKCNVALNEWLGSPIIYRETPQFRPQLAAMIPRFFNPIAAVHHYRSMAERSFSENFTDGRIRLKKLFYVLRPLLACRWIEKNVTQPPTEFSALVAATGVSSDEKRWIADLLVEKSAADEAHLITLETRRAEAIREELRHYSPAADRVSAPMKIPTGSLDSILRNWADWERF
jgi:predicted nucleotidyltransferase